VLHLQTEADIKIAPSLALRLKLMSDLDISEKRLPQDGRFAVRVKTSASTCVSPPCRPSTANRW
jgi:MSHA biogenesis protein MshE